MTNEWIKRGFLIHVFYVEILYIGTIAKKNILLLRTSISKISKHAVCFVYNFAPLKDNISEESTPTHTKG